MVLSEQTFFCWVTAVDRRNVWVVGNDYRLLRSSGWNDWSGSAVAPAPQPGGRAATGAHLQRLMGAAHILL